MVREMKDSGVEWIGEIPADWRTARFKYMHSGTNVGESIDKEYWSENSNDTVFYTAGLNPISTTYKDFPSWKYVNDNDLLLARNGTPYVYMPIIKSVYSDHIIRVTIKNSYDKRYAKYCLQHSILSENVNVVSIATWSASLWNKQILPLPDFIIQQKIADFLDKKCSQIDTALEKTRTTIEEYKKFKQAIITKAVTKGIRGDRPMKDSGIEWIGEIPTEWGIPKLKYIAKLSSGGTPDRRHHEYWNGNIKWIKTGELQNNVITDSQEYITELALKNSAVILYKPDTILVAMYGQGKTRGMTAFLQTVATTNQACAGIVVKNKNIYPKFIWKYLIGSYIAIREKAQGSGQPNLNISMLADFYVTLPSLKEQQEIADYLDKKCAAIDTLIAKKEQLITDLESYKKSLIYEYVTGKKEVN